MQLSSGCFNSLLHLLPAQASSWLSPSARPWSSRGSHRPLCWRSGCHGWATAISTAGGDVSAADCSWRWWGQICSANFQPELINLYVAMVKASVLNDSSWPSGSDLSCLVQVGWQQSGNGGERGGWGMLLWMDDSQTRQARVQLALCSVSDVVQWSILPTQHIPLIIEQPGGLTLSLCLYGQTDTGVAHCRLLYKLLVFSNATDWQTCNMWIMMAG